MGDSALNRLTIKGHFFTKLYPFEESFINHAHVDIYMELPIYNNFTCFLVKQ